MARRRRRDEDEPGRRRRSPSPDSLPNLPDRRALERTLHGIVGQADPGTPQGQAQELLFEAFEADDPERQAALARQALAIWPDCAGAYVLLAENAHNARQSVAPTVIFSEEVDLPLADVEATKQHGWEVAREDAWPLVLHKERGLSHRPPLGWELELLEGCLRAVLEFVSRRPQDDPAPEEIVVPVASGQLRLVLSWVVEDG